MSYADGSCADGEGLCVRRGMRVLAVGVLLLAVQAAWGQAAPAAGGAALPGVDGFVTQVDSAAGFEVGSLRVVVGPQAGCWVRTVFSLNMFSPSPGLWGTPYGYVERAHKGKGRKEKAVACGELHLRVGSEVHLVGSELGAGRFLADKVVRVDVSYAVPDMGMLSGLALLESAAEVERTAKGWSGTVWVDGYPVRVTPETKLVAMPGTTSLLGRVQKDGTVRRTFPAVVGDAQENADAAVKLLRANSWVRYEAAQGEDGVITATELRVWPNERHREGIDMCCRLSRHHSIDVSYETYLRRFAAEVHEPDYGKVVAGTIKFRRGRAIEILADKGVQDYVSRVGREMVPQYQKSLPDSDATKIRFRFYVVKPFKAFLGSGFEDINGMLPMRGDYGSVYSNPPPFQVIRDITAVPDGMILIPESLLVRVRNEAELAALLSYAVTSVVQEEAYRIWMAEMFGPRSGLLVIDDLHPFILRRNQQVLRLGLRPMLRAGYDVRVAPYAWQVVWRKSGNAAANPENRRVATPWYAQYSMGVLRDFYADVEYGKLRLGEGEYGGMLGELKGGGQASTRP